MPAGKAGGRPPPGPRIAALNGNDDRLGDHGKSGASHPVRGLSALNAVGYQPGGTLPS
jgi:hypothetical protein